MATHDDSAAAAAAAAAAADDDDGDGACRIDAVHVDINCRWTVSPNDRTIGSHLSQTCSLYHKQ